MKQFILIGALLAYGTTLIDYRLLRAYAPILWLISIIGLMRSLKNTNWKMTIVTKVMVTG